VNADSTIGVAVAVVIRHSGDGRPEFLVGRRDVGAVDGPDAAARECLEETGLHVSIGDVLDRSEGVCSAGSIDVWFFAATPVDDRLPKPPFTWLSVAELMGRTFPKTNKRLLENLQRIHGGS
jgi:8-oxo-dGTP pyrophosphatase MutT (NUDIX family)